MTRRRYVTDMQRTAMRAPLTVYCRYCGKNGHASKKIARRTMRKAHPGAALNVYQCQSRPNTVPPLWHYGHPPSYLPSLVERREQVLRDESERPLSRIESLR